jgi:NAD(P)-dependent dehydrogenase (short-subunit alcohol dehydrogenase family)
MGLAASGAKVVVIARNKDKAQNLVVKIEAAGGTALAISCDVLDAAAIAKSVDIVGNAFGSCDILLNGAGGNNPRATTSKERLDAEDVERIKSKLYTPTISSDASTLFELDPESVRSVFDLNFLGTFIPTQAFARVMATRPGATIVNIASMGSYSPMTKVPAYCAAKAAVVNFTEWLAVHLAPAGIRVNAIAPGFFLGEQNRSLLQNPDGSLTQRGERIIARTPAGRFGVPADLVGTLLWLCDATASGFVTGAVIPIDGGFNAYTGI